MIITKPGNITHRIILLGRKESTIYLLRGKDEYAILGGGMVHIAPEILTQIKAFNIEEKYIKRLIILHSHFDHCGIVPFLKRRLPWMTISGSAQTKDLMQSQKFIDAVESMNSKTLQQFGRQQEARDLGLKPFSGVEIEEVLKDGDRLQCGDLNLEILEVPGHSSCSLAVYVPEERAMFGSDAGGIPFENNIFTAANSNFDQYQASLEKMAQYDINIYLSEHFGARTGSDGKTFLKKSIQNAKETRRFLEESLSRTQDVKQSAEEFTDKIMSITPDNFLPREILLVVATQMLKYLSRKG